MATNSLDIDKKYSDILNKDYSSNFPDNDYSL